MDAQHLPGRPLTSSSWLQLERIEQSELLDQGYGKPDEVAANLNEMWLINRTLGGLNALTRHLHPRLIACGPDVTVADWGTGSADIPTEIARWGRRHGLNVRIFGVDWAARNLSIAKSRIRKTPEVSLIRANSGQPPFAPGTVDFVISSLFLHHFPPDQVVHVLGAAFQTARRGVIMSDLVRGWLPLAAFRLIQPVFARSYLTRHDGALSIQRAYTPDELRALAAEAGLHKAKVFIHWPWRMTLVADKPLPTNE